MIRYTLKCSRNHSFEAWFPDSAACDLQIEKKLVNCSVCGDTDVRKAIMAPNIICRKRKEDQQDLLHPLSSDKKIAVEPSEFEKRFIRRVEKLRAYIRENCFYVGEDFPEAARRIYYGEEEAHGIYGEATLEEAEELSEEGIEFFMLPYDLDSEKDDS